MTPEAGVLVLREIGENTRIIDCLVDATVDERYPSYIRHDMKELLADRIFKVR